MFKENAWIFAAERYTGVLPILGFEKFAKTVFRDALKPGLTFGAKKHPILSSLRNNDPPGGASKAAKLHKLSNQLHLIEAVVLLFSRFSGWRHERRMAVEAAA